MKNLLCVLMLSLAFGCTTALVRPYVGEQQAWPTSLGSIVNTKYALPVFTSLPPTPYAVLCELRIESPLYATPEEHHLPLLIKKAKQVGADAVILVDGQIFFGTNYGQSGTALPGSTTAVSQVNRFNPEFFSKGVTVVAIQWLAEPPLGLPSRFYPKKRTHPLTAEKPALVTHPSPEAKPNAENPLSKPSPKPETPKNEKTSVEQPTITVTIKGVKPANNLEKPKVESTLPATATPEQPNNNSSAPESATPSKPPKIDPPTPEPSLSK